MVSFSEMNLNNIVVKAFQLDLSALHDKKEDKPSQFVFADHIDGHSIDTTFRISYGWLCYIVDRAFSLDFIESSKLDILAAIQEELSDLSEMKLIFVNRHLQLLLSVEGGPSTHAYAMTLAHLGINIRDLSRAISRQIKQGLTMPEAALRVLEGQALPYTPKVIAPDENSGVDIWLFAVQRRDQPSDDSSDSLTIYRDAAGHENVFIRDALMATTTWMYEASIELEVQRDPNIRYSRRIIVKRTGSPTLYGPVSDAAIPYFKRFYTMQNLGLASLAHHFQFQILPEVKEIERRLEQR
ncbi:hypothetical protein HII31_10553 [Pseudocercospora fuligena]|uniref:Uncharacterized protein n=1 Tax=Pseudocercospora fuligena TaxID=685502 RepID=A0A8H6R8V3_9PEZI|nr:hypothetical protein HII31_10553 [Pseudocercospora fuligena]